MILLVVSTVVSGGMTGSLRTLAGRIDDITEANDGTRVTEDDNYAE